MHLHQIARALGIVAALAAAAFLALGFLTYTFAETEGVVLDAERKRFRPVGEYVRGKGSGFARKATLEDIDICYRYRVGVPMFEKCTIGFGVSHITLAPLQRDAWESLGPDDPVRVYYLRHYPSIAVLHRGPDWVMSIGLALVASIFLAVAAWVARWERPPNIPLKRRRVVR